jgi:hypothetical protein
MIRWTSRGMARSKKTSAVNMARDSRELPAYGLMKGKRLSICFIHPDYIWNVVFFQTSCKENSRPPDYCDRPGLKGY